MKLNSIILKIFFLPTILARNIYIKFGLRNLFLSGKIQVLLINEIIYF